MFEEKVFKAIQHEFEEFLSDVNQDNLYTKKYLDTWDDKYDLTHEEFYDAQNELLRKIESWLKGNNPNQYRVFWADGVVIDRR